MKKEYIIPIAKVHVCKLTSVICTSTIVFDNDEDIDVMHSKSQFYSIIEDSEEW